MVGAPVQLIAIPLFAAFLMPLLGKAWKELVRLTPGVVIAYLLYLSVTLLGYTYNNGRIVEVIAGWSPPWGIDLVYSPFSGFLATLMLFIGLLVWIYSYRYQTLGDYDDYEPTLKYYLLLMMLITASVGVVLTGDIFNLFVFIEILGITAYGLTAYYRGRDGAEASFKYLFIGSFSSVLMLLGIMIIYSQLGTLNMADIAVKAHDLKPVYKITALVLFLVAFGIEAEMFPLNGWAPDAYSQAPAPVGAAFAGIVVKAGLYTVIRLIYTLFDVGGTYEYLIWMGIITMIIAEFSAIAQDNLKRMLAYSSIGQMGLVLVAFGIGKEEGVFAALFLMFNHAIIKSLLFMSGSQMVYMSKTKSIYELNGVGKALPVTAFLFALGAFAIVGFPPFAGFWSKLAVLTAAADSGMILIVALILSISLIEVVYYLRVVNRIYFVKKEKDLELRKPTPQALFSMLVLGVVILIVGFYPDIITGVLHKATAALLDKGSYINDVLSLSQTIN